nr:MAG TPA: hypothetical protein [Caudoviricetes sp.]
MKSLSLIMSIIFAILNDLLKNFILICTVVISYK